MGHGKVKIGSTVFSASNTGTWFGCGYKTRLDLFEKFRGTAEEEQVSEEAKKSMAFGSFFEDAVARYYAEQKGWKIKRCGETAYWSDDMPYFICHPDRLVIGRDEEGRRVALEIKCVSPYADGWGEEGTEEIPDVYYFQVQSYYACEVPCDIVHVVCMKGNRITAYPIERDEEVVSEIRKRVSEAYENFKKGIVPNTENYEEANKYYGKRVRHEEDGVGANDEVLGIYDRLVRIHYDQGILDEQEKNYKKELMEKLGEFPAFLTTENGKVKKICYWTETTRSALNSDRLEKEHPEINLDEYRSVSKTATFRITYPRKEKTNG